MGSGKSVTGKALASRLSLSFVDLDFEIEKKEGRSINDIFAQSGEPYFRNVEAAVLAEFSKKKNYVFAAGGGIVLREENIRRMKETGRVILLKTSAKTLWQRLQYSMNRPLLKRPDPLGELEQILADREVFYEKAADLTVLTDGKLADDVAADIQKSLEAKK